MKYSHGVIYCTFEIVVDVALVLNAVVIGIQTYPELAGMPVEVDPHYADG